ncbi:hypothetical protein HanPSC8_Chr14g0596961 [Helianthus annuus]|nr:hypothetical protein HanPSC8_Chr14g0596961 [Helianthus annuus]
MYIDVAVTTSLLREWVLADGGSKHIFLLMVLLAEGHFQKLKINALISVVQKLYLLQYVKFNQ